MSRAGDYLFLDESWFYTAESDLNDYVDKFKLPEESSVSVKGKARATPKPKAPPKGKTSKEPATPKHKAPKVYKNPILPDGSVKRGRPRKEWAGPRGQKRKRGEVDVDADSGVAESASVHVATEPSASEPAEPPAKKRRGRAPKRRTVQGADDSIPGDQDATMVTEQVAQSQSSVAVNRVLQTEGVAEGTGSSVSVLTQTKENGFQDSLSLLNSNTSRPAANFLGEAATAGGPSHPTLQSAIIASSSAATHVQDPLTDFHVDQEVARQIIESISALTLPGQSHDVPIDPALMQGSSTDAGLQTLVCWLVLIAVIIMFADILCRLRPHQFPNHNQCQLPRQKSGPIPTRDLDPSPSHQPAH